MSVAPAEVDLPRSADESVPDKPWLTIVWNDPVNLMSYVTYVFEHVFGYPRPKAEKLMLDVHRKGRAVVASGTREAMERNVEVLHGYGLWATVRQDGRWRCSGQRGMAASPSGCPGARRRCCAPWSSRSWSC